MRIDEFLKTVVTSPDGFFCLATKEADATEGNFNARIPTEPSDVTIPSGKNGAASQTWHEFWYDYPREAPAIVAHALEAATKANVYFSAHLFGERRSIKAAVLPSRTIQADLDHAEIATIPVIPSVLVKTSPGRHQGYWITETILEPDQLESFGRRIAYSIPNCDRTGWSVGHKVRLPDTFNYKYPDSGPLKIEVAGISLRDLGVNSFDVFPDPKIDLTSALRDIDWLNDELPVFDTTALELLIALKQYISPRVYSQYTKPSRDRSAALWALCCEAFKAGCSRDQVLHLAINSANNKFADRKYNGIRDLRNDIIRAERSVLTKEIDLKALVMELRHLQGEHIIVKRKKITEVVLNNMRETGEFVHCKGGMLWWLRKDTGRPVAVTSHSDWLNAYLSQTVGLNATEQEQKFVIQEIMAFCRNLPVSDDLVSLSHYDPRRGVLLVHTGGRDVLHISRDSVEQHPNGYGSTVFLWANASDYFSLGNAENIRIEANKLPGVPGGGGGGSTVYDWPEVLFKDMLYNIVGLSRPEAIVILRAWFLFLLFRNNTSTRPILALYGQPGASKTTTAKLFYRLIYGYYKSVSGITSGDDFDMSVSTLPFVTFDNMDTWVAWLPDKLALCAGNSDIEKRKLYTDMDTIYLRRQAMIAITAHNPKFSREDITDRLLLLVFKRLEHFKSESDILDRVSGFRNDLWASIVLDVQRILATPKPAPHEVPQFRIEDFASLGYWFSKAVSPETAALFTSAVGKVQGRQRAFNLEEDQTLVNAILKYLDKRDPAKSGYETVSTIWARLSLTSTDPDLFRRKYRDAQTLGKKLWVVQNSLKDVIEIEWQDDKALGARVWKFDKKIGV